LPVFKKILPGISRTLSFTGNPCASYGESSVRIREILDRHKRIDELIMHGIGNQAKGAGVNGMKIRRGCDHKKVTLNNSQLTRWQDARHGKLGSVTLPFGSAQGTAPAIVPCAVPKRCPERSRRGPLPIEMS